jgi:DNA ligase-1
MNTYTEFQLIYDFVEASNSTNSNTDKLEVLKTYTQYDSVNKALLYTYDTYKQYGVTSKNCKKNSDLIGPSNVFGDFFLLLDYLNDRILTGHDAIKAVNRYVLENKEYEDLIWNIIDRNLKTRSTTSMINKVVPGLIPTFDVALANAYNDKTAKKVDWKDGWYVSRKLDGVRCLTVIDDTGNINFFSRAGNPFLTLDALKPSIQKLGLTNMVLDGEICMTDKDGNEDFQGIIKEIKRKDHTIKNPVYFMFDILTKKEFEDKTSESLLSARLSTLRSFVLAGDKFITVLDQKIGNDNHLANMMEISKNEGWEGLMLRKDDTYQGKRSNDILKVKKFFDAEYTVIDLENAVNRVIVEGKEVDELMLKNVVVEHKGNRVQVGSGFSHEQKRYFFENPNEILGKTITVQYFEETTDQTGKHSLRFPVMKGIYEGERTF